MDHHRDGRLLPSIQVKNLAAWLFDALWSSIRHKVPPQAYANLTADFTRMQTAEVLDAVTPFALWELVVKLKRPEKISRLRWRGTGFNVTAR